MRPPLTGPSSEVSKMRSSWEVLGAGAPQIVPDPQQDFLDLRRRLVGEGGRQIAPADLADAETRADAPRDMPAERRGPIDGQQAYQGKAEGDAGRLEDVSDSLSDFLQQGPAGRGVARQGRAVKRCSLASRDIAPLTNTPFAYIL
jgi:hypothetical protein